MERWCAAVDGGVWGRMGGSFRDGASFAFLAVFRSVERPAGYKPVLPPMRPCVPPYVLLLLSVMWWTSSKLSLVISVYLGTLDQFVVWDSGRAVGRAADVTPASPFSVDRCDTGTVRLGVRARSLIAFVPCFRYQTPALGRTAARGLHPGERHHNDLVLQVRHRNDLVLQGYVL